MTNAWMRTARVASVAGLLFGLLGFSQPATASSSDLAWAPPVLTNPVTINISSSNRNLVLDNNTDYRLVMTSAVNTPGGLIISGGRNVVMIGGEIIAPTAAVAPTDTDRRGLYLKGQTGTIHIEGLHIGGADLTEGIDLDERNGATVQLENLRIDTVHGTQSTNHADLLQTWAGPNKLRIDRFSGSTQYQGFFLLPHQLWSGSISQWDLRNVDIQGTPESGYFLWKEDNQDVALNNVNVSRVDNSTNKLAWPNPAAWAGFHNGSASVLSGTPGMSYATPGYAGVTTTTTAALTSSTTTTTTVTPTTTTTAPSTTTTPGTTTTIPTVTTAPPTTVLVPPGTTTTAAPALPARPARNGYWMASADGGVFAMGDAGFFGSTGNLKLNKPVVALASTPTGNGYWLVASDGGVFSFGDAAFFGSTGSMSLNKPIVGMASTPSGKGYWMVASDGGIFSFGDAKFYGSTGAIALNKPVVGMASTPTGKGYWLVASDGGVFSFGDAQFYGSTGALALNQPVVAVSAAPTGHGYRFIAADGGVFAFGDAPFVGSAAGQIRGRAAGLQSTATGNGYWITSSDGWVGAYGDAADQGRIDTPLNAAVVATATLAH